MRPGNTDGSPGLTGQRLADNLRTARERAGLSQAELAQRMAAQGWRFHQQTVARIEGGARRVLAEEVGVLAYILSISVDDLFRSHELAVDGWLILDDARKLREAHAEALKQARRFASVHADLERRIAEAEAEGHGGALATELSAGRRAARLTLKVDVEPDGEA